jgi:hypothetical protein
VVGRTASHHRVHVAIAYGVEGFVGFGYRRLQVLNAGAQQRGIEVAGLAHVAASPFLNSDVRFKPAKTFSQCERSLTMGRMFAIAHWRLGVAPAPKGSRT